MSTPLLIKPESPALSSPAVQVVADAAPAPAVDAAFRAKAEKGAEKFEAYLIGQMLHQMRSSMRELASDDSPFKDRINQDMLDMADQQVADCMAQQRAFGIADAVLRQLLPPAPAPVPAAMPAPGSTAPFKF